MPFTPHEQEIIHEEHHAFQDLTIQHLKKTLKNILENSLYNYYQIRTIIYSDKKVTVEFKEGPNPEGEQIFQHVQELFEEMEKLHFFCLLKPVHILVDSQRRVYIRQLCQKS
jgi:hypothetical protein